MMIYTQIACCIHSIWFIQDMQYVVFVPDQGSELNQGSAAKMLNRGNHCWTRVAKPFGWQRAFPA